jgi:cobalt-zinc-cadmium efflux system protein
MDHNASHNRLLIALVLGLTYMFLALIGGYLANSLALFADGGHLLIHNGALIIAFISSVIAGKKANEKFSYGYGRMESIGGYTNSLILMGVALFVAYEAVSALLFDAHHEGHAHDHGLSMDGSLLVSVIALCGLFLHLISAWVLYKGREQSLNVYAVYLHLLFDVASTFVAFLAGIIGYFTAFEWVDSLAGLLIAILIFKSAYNLMKANVKRLLDAVPDHIDYKAVANELSKIPHVKDVHDVYIRNATRGVEMSAHLVLENDCLHGDHWHKCRAEAEKRLKDKFDIHHTVLQLESACEHD